MKSDFVLIGDYIRLKLREKNLPAEGYILLEAVVLMILAAKANFTLPFSDVPFTLQSLVAVMTGAIYGPRSGVLSMSLYLLLGLVGLPVFSGQSSGNEYFMSERGGFLLGFVAAAGLSGYMARVGWGRKIGDGLKLMFLGHTILIIMGLAGIALSHDSEWELLPVFIGILPGMLVKSAVGAALLRFFWSWLENQE